MKKIQVTLTVEESKELIAKNILNHPKFKQAYESGCLVLKGGTTVSRISENVTGISLRICGRITERGTVSSSINSKAPHTLIYSQGLVENIDEELVKRFSQLDQSALIVCSANAIDIHGHAVLMAGSNGGGTIGQSISSWQTEGADLLIPVGLEKLVPGNLKESVSFASRKNVDFSNGMSVGLMPLYGELFTEIEAFELMGDVSVHVIGSGGLLGAKGSKTFQIKGDDAAIDRILDLVSLIKSKDLEESGDVESLKECAYPSSRCGSHLGCSYKSGALAEKKSKKLGVLTIGQAPRNDFMQDILPLLSDRFHVLERGALDPFEKNEIIERFSPDFGDKVLVSRMRNGSQVVFAEKYISPLIQDAVKALEKKKCDIILLMCTGKFPEIEHESILIKPQELIPPMINKIAGNKFFGLIIPDESQREQMYEWWDKSEDELIVHTASPYQSMEALDLAAQAMKADGVDLIFMDCMGYTKAMKRRVEEITGKMVILPRTLITRIINEL
jgi:hypothetical protein